MLLQRSYELENSSVLLKTPMLLPLNRKPLQDFGVKHALMVNAGTSAIICALTSVGIGPRDEVILPRYTFIATAAAIVGVGAIPIIAEIDESLRLDPQDPRSTT